MYHQSGFSQTLYVSDHTEMKIIDSFDSAFQVHMDEYTCDPPLFTTSRLTIQNIHIYILHVLMVSSKVSFSSEIVAMAGRSQESRKGSILKSFSGVGAIYAWIVKFKKLTPELWIISSLKKKVAPNLIYIKNHCAFCQGHFEKI